MSHVQQKLQKRNKKSRTINVYVLLLIVLLVATVFTHIIPAGEYARIDFNGREIVDSDSFKYVDKSPASFFDFFKAIHSGMVSAADIIFLF